MNDLRQAAQQALDALDSNNPDIQLRAAVTLRAALAAPQFEAVTPQPQPNVLPDHEEYGAGMYFRITPQPEPVAYYNFQTHKMRWAKPTTYDQFVSVDVPELPLYTHPPQRQPLTDEQMREVLRQCPYDTNEVLRVRWLYAKDFARAIEKAHGIEGDK